MSHLKNIVHIAILCGCDGGCADDDREPLQSHARSGARQARVQVVALSARTLAHCLLLPSSTAGTSCWNCIAPQRMLVKDAAINHTLSTPGTPPLNQTIPHIPACPNNRHTTLSSSQLVIVASTG
jgi:hypothetical protein